jgi:hypothetical protein
MDGLSSQHRCFHLKLGGKHRFRSLGRMGAPEKVIIFLGRLNWKLCLQTRKTLPNLGLLVMRNAQASGVACWQALFDVANPVTVNAQCNQCAIKNQHPCNDKLA